MLVEYNNYITLYRLQETSGKKNFNQVDSDIWVFIYSISEDMAILNDIEAGQENYKMMSDYSGFQTWDKIVDQDSNVYIIDRVNKLNSNIWEHFEMIIHKEYD